MDDADTDRDDTTLAEALPVELVVELGWVKLTGAQVLDLESGDVVALTSQASASITFKTRSQPLIVMLAAVVVLSMNHFSMSCLSRALR